MLTVREVAARFRLSEITVRRWLKAGTLKGVRLGGTKAVWRIPESEVARLLKLTGEDEVKPQRPMGPNQTGIGLVWGPERVIKRRTR